MKRRIRWDIILPVLILVAIIVGVAWLLVWDAHMDNVRAQETCAAFRSLGYATHMIYSTCYVLFDGGWASVFVYP